MAYTKNGHTVKYFGGDLVIHDIIQMVNVHSRHTPVPDSVKLKVQTGLVSLSSKRNDSFHGRYTVHLLQ